MTLDPRTRRLTLALWLAAAVPGSAQQLTLAEAADSALAHHPVLRAAEARVDGAQAGRRAARAARVPSVAVSGAVNRFQEPMVVAPLHGFDPMNPPDFDRTVIQSQLGLRYTLFDGGARGARIRGADAHAGASEASRDESRMAVLEAAAAAFLRLASARDVAEAVAGQLDALEAEVDRAGRHYREGTAARVELLRAEAARQDARAQDAAARSAVTVAEASLARVMGTSPATVRGRPLAVASTRFGPDREGTGPSPRIQAAERAVTAARAGLDHERAGRMPSLQAGAGLLSFGSGGGEFVTEWQAGVQVSWPVFTGGARQAAVRRAEADLLLAEEQLRLAKLEDAERADQASAAVTDARARAGAHEAAVTQWEEVARIEALRLNAGTGVQSDYLRAQAALLNARAGLARARNELVLARIQLAHARGELSRTWLDAAVENQP